MRESSFPTMSVAHIGRALLSIAILAILVVGTGAFLLSYHSVHRHTAGHLQTLISFAASESASAIEFRDSQTAAEILQSIPPEVGLTAAEIRDASNVVLARFERRPEGLIGALASLVRMPRVERDVFVEGQRIGSVTLEGGAEPVLRTLMGLLAWIVFGMMLFAGCALTVGRIYTTRFTAPILQLRETIQRLIEHRDFSQRAPPSSLAEVEDLRLEFNILLDEIGLRDRLLTQSNDALRRAAYIDVLTGLPNRAMFESVLQSTIETSNRDRSRACLFYLDIDAFKSINDTFGHGVGDELLSYVAMRLRLWRQHETFAARLGGDEFVVLLAPLAEDAKLDDLLCELRAVLEQPVDRQNVEILPGVSIGTAIYPDSASGPEQLMHQADRAMYLIKSKHHQHGQRTRWRVVAGAGEDIAHTRRRTDEVDASLPYSGFVKRPV